MAQHWPSDYHQFPDSLVTIALDQLVNWKGPDQKQLDLQTYSKKISGRYIRLEDPSLEQNSYPKDDGRNNTETMDPEIQKRWK